MIERTTRESVDELVDAAIAAVMTATSSRSSTSSSSSAAGAATGAAAGAGAAFFAFILFSKTLMNLKQLIRMLMKISTRNTVPMPSKVFMAALAMFSPTVYSGLKVRLTGFKFWLFGSMV